MDPIPFSRAPAESHAPLVAERRTMRRVRCAIDVTARQRGRFAVAAATADLTPHGARLTGAGPFATGTEMSLGMPGMASQTVRVIWSQGATTGIAFAQPLDRGAFTRFVPADGRLTLVGGPAEPTSMRAEVARLASRAQTLRGLEAAQEGPRWHAKRPVGGGLAGIIRRSRTLRDA